MKIQAAYYSSRFKKSLRKYRNQKAKLTKKINLFLEAPFDKSLKTHKLSGKLADYWSFSVGQFY